MSNLLQPKLEADHPGTGDTKLCATGIPPAFSKCTKERAARQEKLDRAKIRLAAILGTSTPIQNIKSSPNYHASEQNTDSTIPEDLDTEDLAIGKLVLAGWSDEQILSGQYTSLEEGKPLVQSPTNDTTSQEDTEEQLSLFDKEIDGLIRTDEEVKALELATSLTQPPWVKRGPRTWSKSRNAKSQSETQPLSQKDASTTSQPEDQQPQPRPQNWRGRGSSSELEPSPKRSRVNLELLKEVNERLQATSPPPISTFLLFDSDNSKPATKQEQSSSAT